MSSWTQAKWRIQSTECKVHLDFSLFTQLRQFRNTEVIKSPTAKDQIMPLPDINFEKE